MKQNNSIKAQIVYIKGHSESEKQAQECLKSFNNFNWNAHLHEGLTADIIENEPEFNYTIIENSRLHDFKKENYHKFLTKVSCAINHIRFWRKVVETNETMAFIEHDSICTTSWDSYIFDEYLILNCEFVFRPPNKLGLVQYKDYNWPSFGLCSWPTNYPLKYHKENKWKNSNMAPGTAAYAITPEGAKKMLTAVEKYGLDQSDFMINSFNLKMQYCIPSPIKFNKTNLSTSYGTL